MELLADTLAELAARQPGGRECAGELCWHALTTGRCGVASWLIMKHRWQAAPSCPQMTAGNLGLQHPDWFQFPSYAHDFPCPPGPCTPCPCSWRREQLVVSTACQLLQTGRAAEAAAAVQALYSLGQPQQVARVVAEAVVDAVERGSRAVVATVAASQVLMWRQGAVPLLRDLQLALAHRGSADAAAQVSWHALQWGEGEMVAAVAAEVVRSGAEREAAELACQLYKACGTIPPVAEVLGQAMAAAVRGGSAPEAAAATAHLLRMGQGALLRGATAHLVAAGRCGSGNCGHAGHSY